MRNLNVIGRKLPWSDFCHILYLPLLLLDPKNPVSSFFFTLNHIVTFLCWILLLSRGKGKVPFLYFFFWIKSEDNWIKLEYNQIRNVKGETMVWWASIGLNPEKPVSQFSSVQSLSHVQFCDPWTAAYQASLSITNSQSLLKLMSIESVMPSNHLILCHPFLHLPSVFLSIRVFANESVLHIRWPKYWSFSFSISPSNEYSGLISFRIDWFDLLEVQGTLFSNTTVQNNQFFDAQLSLWSNSHIHTWLLEKP